MLLNGVRVLDLSRLLPGAYCTQLLQAQGAQVTKIEPPAGDPIRALPGGEAYFDALHRGKRLLTLDLKTDDGRDALRRHVVGADVLVEGFRPGVMERMELGYAALAAINPALVYCAITGYGSGGPMAGRAGHDLNYLARSGALSLMPLRDGIPAIPGLQVADLAGGLVFRCRRVICPNEDRKWQPGGDLDDGPDAELDRLPAGGSAGGSPRPP